MLEKIDVRAIIRDHLNTFWDYAGDRRSLRDAVVFFVLPLALGTGAIWRGFQLNAVTVNALLTAFSIFATVLLSVLVMLFNFAQTTAGLPGDKQTSIRRRLLREVHANISFSILIAIVIVSTTLVSLSQLPAGRSVIHPIWTFILVVGSVSFVLNLLMILKRMYALMGNELDNHRSKKSA